MGGGPLEFFGELTAGLCEAVSLTVELNTPGEDGQTRLDHLIQVENATGQSHVPEIDIPFAGIHLWEWFWVLSNSRGSSGFGGASPLSFSEIEAWARVCRVEPHPWEIDVLKAMDAEYMKAQNDLSKQKSSKAKKGTQNKGKR